MLEGKNVPAMKSLRFRQEREATWTELEELLLKIEKQGRQSLSTDECLALPRLYRSSLSALSVARAISLDTSVTRYLETLCMRAYIHVYGSRTHMWDAVTQFFVADWPQMVRALWKPICVATIVLFGSWILGHFLVASNSEWFYTFLGEGTAQGRTPTASKTFLRASLFQDGPEKQNGLALFAAFLFGHNAKVTLFSFALGFALGVPTLLLLFMNGAMGGALSAVYVRHDLGVDLYGWLIIHGSTELFAIILGAGAGLHMGAAVAFPQAISRRDALRNAGRQAAVLGIGCVVMLFVAGLLEGFARQLVQDTPTRFAIGFFMLLLWLAYFSLVGRRRV
jgi:uncharacterized membrane protein SpoIIM required for sporulation